MADSIQMDRDAYVQSGDNRTGTFGQSDSGVLDIAGRDSSYNRKIYLGVDLAPVFATIGTPDNVALTLTIDTTKTGGFIRGSSAEKAPSTIRLYAVATGASVWSETAITWNNAPANNTGSRGAFLNTGATSGAGVVVEVASVVLDPVALPSGGVVTFSDPRLTDFVTWVTANKAEVGTDITFMLGTDNAIASVPGYHFYSKDAAVSDTLKPRLDYDPPKRGTLILFSSTDVLSRLPHDSRMAAIFPAKVPGSADSARAVLYPLSSATVR
ncbi:MAG: DNRLRE domain-containing protein [Opitutaceae bacterium]|nr:DNRLRE domain-containing protein [Opitutaceae bacterium]